MFNDSTAVIAQSNLENPSGVIYSTGPKMYFCDDEYEYVVKGFGCVEVVRAEASAYKLAAEIGIPTPPWKFIRVPGEKHGLFGSQLQKNVVREIDAHVKRGRVSNPAVLSEIVGFDVWLANVDRNIGNLLGRACAVTNGSSDIEIVAIDFEQSITVRDATPRMICSTLDPKRLWPREELGVLLSNLPPPTSSFVARIKALDSDKISGLLSTVAGDLGLGQEWLDLCVSVLVERGEHIEKLLMEVWKCKPN